MADTATNLVPPGRAQVTQCPDCHGSPSSDCPECDGTGKILYRACPRCGDIAWDYTSDRQEMACRISCGYRWTAEDPAGRSSDSPKAANAGSSTSRRHAPQNAQDARATMIILNGMVCWAETHWEQRGSRRRDALVARSTTRYGG